MEDFDASGQPIQEWVSTQEGISVYQFHYWRKKFKEEDRGITGTVLMIHFKVTEQ
nr:hypothetical protein [Bacillus sp. es.036]